MAQINETPPELPPRSPSRCATSYTRASRRTRLIARHPPRTSRAPPSAAARGCRGSGRGRPRHRSATVATRRHRGGRTTARTRRPSTQVMPVGWGHRVDDPDENEAQSVDLAAHRAHRRCSRSCSSARSSRCSRIRAPVATPPRATSPAASSTRRRPHRPATDRRSPLDRSRHHRPAPNAVVEAVLVEPRSRARRSRGNRRAVRGPGWTRVQRRTRRQRSRRRDHHGRRSMRPIPPPARVQADRGQRHPLDRRLAGDVITVTLAGVQRCPPGIDAQRLTTSQVDQRNVRHSDGPRSSDRRARRQSTSLTAPPGDHGDQLHRRCAQT